MKKKGLLLLLLIAFTLSCSSGGGSSSGSGGNVMGSSSTYAKEDLAGDWSYTARQQGGTASCSGTMTFDNNVHLVGVTNSCCKGGQAMSQTEFWFWNYGHVKGRNYAWCSDTSMLTKYDMDFKGFDKRTISGLMDVHVSHLDGDAYTRFDITLTSMKPVAPPVEPVNEPVSSIKKPVQAAGRVTAPAKR